MYTLAQVAPLLPKIPFWEVAGAAGLVVVLLYVIYLFVTKIFLAKKKDTVQTQFEMISTNLSEIKVSVKESERRIERTQQELAIFKAHYESEERFKRMTEEKLEKLEKVIYGNGKQSLLTTIELVERDIEDLKNKNARKRT